MAFAWHLQAGPTIWDSLRRHAESLWPRGKFTQLFDVFRLIHFISFHFISFHFVSSHLIWSCDFCAANLNESKNLYHFEELDSCRAKSRTEREGSSGVRLRILQIEDLERQLAQEKKKKGAPRCMEGARVAAEASLPDDDGQSVAGGDFARRPELSGGPKLDFLALLALFWPPNLDN